MFKPGDKVKFIGAKKTIMVKQFEKGKMYRYIGKQGKEDISVEEPLTLVYDKEPRLCEEAFERNVKFKGVISIDGFYDVWLYDFEDFDEVNCSLNDSLPGVRC